MVRKSIAVLLASAIVIVTSSTSSAWADPAPVLASNGSACTVLGTEGDDVLTGTEGNDVICGLGGNDNISGLEGNDFLDAGSGDDIVIAGDGDDTIDAGPGNDTVSADSGNDTVSAGSGNDKITGGEGDDNIDAGPGNDTVSSGSGNDKISAGPGNDKITGGEGKDSIDAGPGNDKLLGGPGNDKLLGGPGNDSLNGGAGTDLADFSDNPSLVVANLYAGKSTGAGTDTLKSIEKLVGVTENSQPGSRAWKLNYKSRHATSTSPALEGYTSAPSGLPGAKIDLRVSSTKPFKISAFRLGYYNGDGARLVWKSSLENERNIDKVTTYDASTRTVIPNWNDPIIIDTADWLPGLYLLKLMSSDGSLCDRYVPYVVRSESTAGKVVIQPSVLTAHAYNAWGGRSVYKGAGGFEDRAYAVTLARPHLEGAGAGRLFMPYEYPIVELAEKLNIPVAYETDYDISTINGILNGASAFVSLGHDEYWTQSKYAEVVRARDSGTNLVFFGSNTMYWRARLSVQSASNPSVMTVYKNPRLDPVKNSINTTVRWRSSPKANPESKLIGQQYVCFPADAPVTITNPNFFAFANTGVKRGTTFPHLARVEVDGIPAGSVLPNGASAYTRADISCGAARYVSAITMYIGPKDSGVIDIGSMGWILYGFRDAKLTKFVSQVSANILVKIAQGPLGKVLKPSER